MGKEAVHKFYIPVLGLAFSIDTPIRVARFGITSVISLVDDVLIERMRRHYATEYGEPYQPIGPHEEDHRARRITSYLNLVQRIVGLQIGRLQSSVFENGSEIVRYFEMLSDDSPLKALYRKMAASAEENDRRVMQEQLRRSIVPGGIDVNIMSKLDRSFEALPGRPEVADSSDALAALRGFVRSDLEASIIISAGLNPRLFTYMGRCPEFLPATGGKLMKKVILKVSDYRSAAIQGKVLAKKGVWISEFRVESGLNCGGHAFATEGTLLGPILEEFKEKRSDLARELHELYVPAMKARTGNELSSPLPIRITAQGGIGTCEEDEFLRGHYDLDGTGWGSPFLLVPEATNVDETTRNVLANARVEDYYISDASPMGIPFNNVRGTTSEKLLQKRVEAGKPGSPCTKKYLVSNTEFTESPICTASRQYQALKIKLLKSLGLPDQELKSRVEKVVEKACLCEDLAAAPFADSATKNGAPRAVAICPGPNLAYFSRIVSLEEMVGHIYGRVQLLLSGDRPHMFVNELRLYVDYLKKEIGRRIESPGMKGRHDLDAFRQNLLNGIEYYRSLLPKLAEQTEHRKAEILRQLQELEAAILALAIPVLTQA